MKNFSMDETMDQSASLLKKISEEETAKEETEEMPTPKEKKSKPKSKWEKLEKVNALFNTKHKDFLDDLAKKAMRSRQGGKDKERITANSILRCLVVALERKSHKLNLSDINSEAELQSRILAILGDQKISN